MRTLASCAVVRWLGGLLSLTGAVTAAGGEEHPISARLQAEVDRGERATGAQRMQAELAEPFCYFSVPSDVLGFKDCPEGTQLTGDGALQTSFGELDLYVGSPPQRVHKRVKTLLRGYLPVVQYEVTHAGVRYAIEAFGAPLELEPRNNLISFVRIAATNNGSAAIQAAIGAAFADPAADRSRCQLECQEWYRDRWMQPAAFAAEPAVRLRGATATRGQHLVFTTQGPPGATPAAATAPDTGAPLLLWTFELPPGATQQVDVKLPYVPIHAGHSAAAQALSDADHDQYRARTTRFWDDLLAAGMTVELAEDKVVNTLRASFIYDMIARDIGEDGRTFEQKVNEFNYDRFYSRDTAYFARTYGMLGQFQIARETIERFIAYDDQMRVAGLHRFAPDDWGMSLWALGQYYRVTGDDEFARAVYPAVPPHIAGLEEALASDPDGLWPPANRYDNEMVNGHYTGHNFYALLGLREAIQLAHAVGATADAARFQRIHDAYAARVLARIHRLAEQTGGYIPPGLDDPMDGYDWANASAGVYPFWVLAPHDPLVTATLRTIRENKYQEGIMTWGANGWAVQRRARQGVDGGPGWLHHYNTIYVTDTLVVRGEQRKALEDLYSILAHTSSTHAGFEHEIWQWGKRDPGTNYPPHGWCAAKLAALIRNMLVREQDDALHLGSVLSPVWIAPGRTVRVQGAATYFGRLTYTLAARADGATVALEPAWRAAPREIVLHIPFFTAVSAATADGRPVTVVSEAVHLPPETRIVELKWTWTEQPELSYDSAVRHYLEKFYLQPAGADYAFLFPTPRPPAFEAPNAIFVDELRVALKPVGSGTAHYTLDGSPPGAQSPVYSEPLRLTETTTLGAVMCWPDGRVSEPRFETFTRVSPLPAVPRAGATPRSLRYEYYEGDWPRLPDFATQQVRASGMTASFDPVPLKRRAEHYAVRFTGLIEIPRDGVYRFHTRSDDGSRLYIDGQLVVDNDGEHAATEAAGAVALARGLHALEVAYFNMGGHDELAVLFAAPDGLKQPLAFEQLFADARE